jgi:ATP-dependent Clp protease protease subunit
MTVYRLPPKQSAGGYRVVARGSDRAEIYLYGIIGADWSGEGITAKKFAADLKAAGAVKQIDLRINSEGGSVFDGKAIYSLLNEHKAKVIVHIDGLAASAASYIAMAGDEIEIAEGGYVMIHNAWIMAAGDARELRRTADLLESVNGSLLDTYVARTGGDKAKIAQMMDDETWMTAAEAIQHGFATKMVANLKVAASVNHPDRFKNMPAALNPNASRAAVALARIDALKN